MKGYRNFNVVSFALGVGCVYGIIGAWHGDVVGILVAGILGIAAVLHIRSM